MEDRRPDGYWLRVRKDETHYDHFCSECGFKSRFRKSLFCPRCGARMSEYAEEKK